MLGYAYYLYGQTGWDPNMKRRCPHCGGTSYSSTSLNQLCGGSANCPHCGKEF